MNWVIQHPAYSTINPPLTGHFKTLEAAQKMLKQVIERMELHVQMKKDGYRIGEHSLEDLERDLEHAKRWVIRQV
jgi:hypothetical protein